MNLIHTHYPYYLLCVVGSIRQNVCVLICLTIKFRWQFTNWHLIKKLSINVYISMRFSFNLVDCKVFHSLSLSLFFFNLPNGLRSTCIYFLDFFLRSCVCCLFYQINANGKCTKNHTKFNIHHINHILYHVMRQNEISRVDAIHAHHPQRKYVYFFGYFSMVTEHWTCFWKYENEREKKGVKCKHVCIENANTFWRYTCEYYFFHQFSANYFSCT